MLEAIMEVVSLCAGHRELVQSNLEELNTIYSTRLEILLSSETLGSSNSSSNNNNISNNHSSSYQIAANDILNSRETKHTEFLSQYLPSLSNANHDDDDYLNDGSDNNLNNFSTIQSPYRFPTASSTTKKRNKKNKQQQQQQQQSRQSTTTSTTAAPISKHIDREQQQQHHHYQSTHHNHTDNKNDDVLYGDTYSLSSDAFDEAVLNTAPPHEVVATVVPSSPTYSPSLDYGDIYPYDSALKDEVR